jgi:rubrerythrin
MSFETTKDVLDHARDFHHHLSEYYSQLSDKAGRERVKMLLNYMSRHEKHLAESLSEYEHSVSSKILDTWFQFPAPKEALTTCRIVAVEENTELSVDGIVDLALQLDECLVQLYKSMIESSESEEVREVFTNLLQMEKHEEVELVRNAFRLKGL